MKKLRHLYAVAHAEIARVRCARRLQSGSMRRVVGEALGEVWRALKGA